MKKAIQIKFDIKKYFKDRISGLSHKESISNINIKNRTEVMSEILNGMDTEHVIFEKKNFTVVCVVVGILVLISMFFLLILNK